MPHRKRAVVCRVVRAQWGRRVRPRRSTAAVCGRERSPDAVHPQDFVAAQAASFPHKGPPVYFKLLGD
eukprot:scaffold2504_cov65-Phaeocystis_antarctica.AAC.1